MCCGTGYERGSANPQAYDVSLSSGRAPERDVLELMNQFAGSWDSVAGHQANQYSEKPGAPSVDAAVKFYSGQGVHPSKLVIGMPVYGRAFANTDGIGRPYQGERPMNFKGHSKLKVRGLIWFRCR